jgi:tetratricopeptide (TPR) repeat protein
MSPDICFAALAVLIGLLLAISQLLSSRAAADATIQFAIRPLLVAILLSLLGGIVGTAAAGTAIAGSVAGAEAAGKTEIYSAELRMAVPWSWLDQEFRRQRSFPALARSRQLAAKGKYDQAAAELQGYLASDPDDLGVEFELLVLSTNLKQYRSAIDTANRILAVVPGFGPALYYRGLAQAALGDNKDAVPDLAAAADSGALAPDDARYALRSLALAAVASPAPGDALAFLERQATKPEAGATVLIAEGQLLERLGRVGDAVKRYDDATTHTSDGNDRRTAHLFGAELALKRGDYAGALSRARSAWELAPGNSEVAVELVEAASRLGRTDIVEATERAVSTARHPARSTQEALANALFRVGRYAEASTRFDALATSAESPPDEYRLRRSAGFAAQAAKNAANALSELQRAADINPEPEALSAAAEAAIEAGHLDRAAADLVRLAAASEKRERDKAFTLLSVVREQAGRFAEALAALDQIPPHRRDADIERRAAILAVKAGDRNAAVMHAERLVGLDPTRANLRSLGEAQIAAGRTAAAVESFGRALKAAPEDDPGLREMLANTLQAAGQPERAADAFDALATRAKWPADQYRLRVAAGFSALRAGEPERALVAFRQAEGLDPGVAKAPQPGDEYRLRLAAGFAALKAGDSGRALAAFRLAIEIEPSRKSLEAGAETALQAGRFAEAVGYLERLAAADRDLLASAQHLERLSVVYEEMGRTKEAALALGKLPKAAQQKPEIILRRMVLAQRLGDRRALIDDMRELAAVEPNENNLAALADAEIAAGQASTAAATLNRLLGGHSLPLAQKANYTERLGAIEAARGNMRRAQSLFAEAYRLSPLHPAAWLAQEAESAMQAQDFEGAARHYRILVANVSISRNSRANYAARFGFALASLSREGEALAAYDDAVRFGGATTALHEKRAAVLMRLARPAAAAAEYRAAYDLTHRADLALSLGYAHQATHQPGLAIVFLRRALAEPQMLSPAQRVQASAALGYAYSETEQYSLAAGCFERALGAPPRSHFNCGAGDGTAAVQ